MKKPKIPKDLGIKMGTKEQILWERVAKEARVLIEQSENNLVIQRAMLQMAEGNIAVEKAKMQ